MPKFYRIGDRTQLGHRVAIHIPERYGVAEGKVVQITLPNGRFYYAGVMSGVSERAKKEGLKCEIVHYFGASDYGGINQRAHMGFPIQINEVNVLDFIYKIAENNEFYRFFPM